MDISKASNFERYVFELLERDGAQVKRRFTSGEGFDLSLIPRPGFVSGKSTHADRLATIRNIHSQYGVTIDPHTADGVKVGLQHRDPGVPLICMETALPAKFADTIREALGGEPARPAGLEKLEELPQRFEVIKPDAEALKRYMEKHAG
jgi:threonine synthase